MMTSPKAFYGQHLKGKTAEQIMTVIRGLKQEIGRLKNIMEHPDYKEREFAVDPGEDIQIICTREYLEIAKKALKKAGGTYTPSAAERKAEAFNANIPYINKVVFTIGGYFSRYETKTFVVDGDKAFLSVEQELDVESREGRVELDPMKKEEFLRQLKDLHIGEWRRNYDTLRFGFAVMDGTQWNLEICFSNGHRSVKIHGSNAYPYNFDRVLELFEIEKDEYE